MTPEKIIDAFKKQVENCDQSKPFQVFYVLRKRRDIVPPTPMPLPWWTPDSSEWTVQINLILYDVPALVEQFKDHEIIGFQGKDDALPIFEPITILIP